MNIDIISAQYDNADNTSITFILRDNDVGIEFPFTYIVHSDDNAPVTKWLNECYNDGKVTPDPYVAPIKTDEDLSFEIRDYRNLLLNNTDKYLVIPDYPLSNLQKEEIKNFRQALRNITAQPDFPHAVIWPKVPDCIKNEISISYNKQL